VGIDWGTQAHPVCILNAQGELLGERRVLHSAAALATAGSCKVALGSVVVAFMIFPF